MSRTRGTITVNDVCATRAEIMQAAQSLSATNVRVFGSVARNEAGEKIDVDLLVDIVVEVSGFCYFGLLEELRRTFEAILGQSVHITDGEVLGRLDESARRDSVTL